MPAGHLAQDALTFTANEGISQMHSIIMCCAGNLAVTLSANVAHSLALLGPRQIVQKRGKKMVSDQLDIMLEKDDALFSLVEARQRLEVIHTFQLHTVQQLCIVLLACCRALIFSKG